jgi:hypothetical protein
VQGFNEAPDGQRHYCPRVENQATSGEGRLLLDVLLQPGVWSRAGLAGEVVGIDTLGALSRLPAAMRESETVRVILPIAEAGGLMGARKRGAENETQKPDDFDPYG